MPEEASSVLAATGALMGAGALVGGLVPLVGAAVGTALGATAGALGATAGALATGNTAEYTKEVFVKKHKDGTYIYESRLIPVSIRKSRMSGKSEDIVTGETAAEEPGLKGLKNKQTSAPSGLPSKCVAIC